MFVNRESDGRVGLAMRVVQGVLAVAVFSFARWRRAYSYVVRTVALLAIGRWRCCCGGGYHSLGGVTWHMKQIDVPYKIM